VICALARDVARALVLGADRGARLDGEQESEEVHDGDRATQCPDQGLAAGDHGALERCQPLAGLVSPEGAGTRLTTFDYVLPAGVIGKIADTLIVKRMNGKSLEEGLNNFKALVERQ
jgi:hypothetical protein